MRDHFIVRRLRLDLEIRNMYRGRCLCTSYEWEHWDHCPDGTKPRDMFQFCVEMLAHLRCLGDLRAFALRLHQFRDLEDPAERAIVGQRQRECPDAELAAERVHRKMDYRYGWGIPLECELPRWLRRVKEQNAASGPP